MADLYAIRDGTPRYCVLTTEANASMRGVHSRMPLVLRREQVSLWLRQPEAALRLLRSVPPELEKTPESAQLRLWQVVPQYAEKGAGLQELSRFPA